MLAQDGLTVTAHARWFGLEIGALRLAIDSGSVANMFVRARASHFGPSLEQDPGPVLSPAFPVMNVQEILVHEGRPLLIFSAHDLLEYADGRELARPSPISSGDWIVVLKTEASCSLGLRVDRAAGPFRSFEQKGVQWHAVQCRSMSQQQGTLNA